MPTPVVDSRLSVRIVSAQDLPDHRQLFAPKTKGDSGTEKKERSQGDQECDVAVTQLCTLCFLVLLPGRGLGSTGREGFWGDTSDPLHGV